jgi:uncharacterized transporter YbjL
MTAEEVLLLLMFIAAVGIWCGIGFATKHMPMAGIALLIIAIVIAFVYFVVLHGSVTIRIG